MPETKVVNGNGKLDSIGDISNDALVHIESVVPYVVSFDIEGVCPILFHAWSCEDVEAKSKAAKNSKAKKTDNVESYVYRCPDGTIGLPGEYIRMAMVGAARYRQDPRSPRKSGMDLFKAGIVQLTDIASFGKTEWDYLDQRRVTVQRNGITRTRPAFHAGWKASFEFQVLLAEYIPPADFLDVLATSGKFVGVADFRPTYGRFQVTRYEVL